jgi:hypothetical protein
MQYEEIHSPEEMAEFIVKTANKYNAKLITLGGGFRHTIIYNYDVMECNFMVEHDMTVVNDKGNKYDVNPKEKTLYTISTLDPNGRGMKDAICIEYGFQTDDWILNHVLESGEYKTKGIVQSGWLRGNVYKVVSPAETDAILQFCKIALKSVFRQAAERYEIEKSYNSEI